MKDVKYRCSCCHRYIRVYTDHDPRKCFPETDVELFDVEESNYEPLPECEE